MMKRVHRSFLLRCMPLVCIFLLAPVAQAQVPADTARGAGTPDTLVVPIPASGVDPDTLPADSILAAAQDTFRVPVFPRYPEPPAFGLGYGRWRLGREDLSHYHGLTLLSLIERTPGLTVVRSGDRGSPAGLTALGMGGGRVRILLDGFELDPLGSSTPDIQHIGLIDLESVRIERDPTGIRIELETLRIPENRPISVVEAGTGTYDTKILRGLLARGFGRRSIVTAAYEAVDTEGFAFRSPFAAVGARASWSYALSETTGLQAEIRTTGFQRTEDGVVQPENFDHRLLLLRGRSEVRPGLMLDAAVGRAWRDPANGDFLTQSLSTTQAFARASYALGSGWLELSARGRDSGLEVTSAPRAEIGARGLLRPLPWLDAEAELRSATLGEVNGAVWRAGARATLGGRIGAFAGLTGGSQVVGLVRDTVWETPPVEEGGEMARFSEVRFASRSSGVGSMRAGASWSGGGAALEVAGVVLASTGLVPFGLAYDRGYGLLQVDAATGIETHASAVVPGTRGLLRLDGWAAYWPEGSDRPYLPDLEARGAVTASGLFYEGELEPTLRFEVGHRGTMLSPGPNPGAPWVTTVPYTLTNLHIQIRIQDVQAFGVWENALNYRSAADFRGVPLPGIRLAYGIRWNFRN